MKRLVLHLGTPLVVGILLFPLTAAQTDGATIRAASCAQADVQAAIDAAGDGDVVLVPPGSCTWTTTVSIPNTKGIVLQGAGVGVTMITDGITTGDLLSVSTRSGFAVTEVTGFTFNANRIVKTGGYAEILVAGTGLDRFRFHHNAITDLVTRGIRVWSGGGQEFSGVIDHNTIQATTNASCQGITVFGAGAEDSRPFSRPLELGSSKFIFIEDNTFNFAYVNDGALDAAGGARYVFRHNTVNGTTLGHHGADTGGYRGIHSFEIYDNTFTHTNPLVGTRALFFRSGTGVVFGNTWSGNYRGADIDNYRSCANYLVWGTCDGSSPWDENRAGEQGAACLDQVGHVFTDQPGGSNRLEPLYFWNNTQDGSPKRIGVTSGRCERLSTYHVLENREFYNDRARPGYTPYAYPHPLTLVRPKPPANVTVR